MAKNYFNRYIWLLDIIHRYGHIKMQEINRLWRRSYLNDTGCDIPERTFFNHVNAIRETFGIIIRHDRNTGYYIDNTGDFKGDKLRIRMIQSLSLNNIINESKSLIDRIIPETSSSSKWIVELVKAMKDSNVIRLEYTLPDKTSTKEVEFASYCIKQFDRKWYAIGLDTQTGRIIILDTDRINDLNYTDRTFTYPEDFDPYEYFRHYIGVTMIPEQQPQCIRIRFRTDCADKLRERPIHSSQTEIARDESDITFGYRLIPNPEFKEAILSYGSCAEILQPAWLREEMRKEIERMTANYRMTD